MSTIQAPLLWVPLKTTSDVSYAPSIRQTITQIYQESPDSYKDEIATLDRCRQDALRGSAGSDITGRDLLYKYFGQLELLELRFPEVRVPFPWKDAFTGKEISQLSLAYEKASVIFNIAATLSSLAAQQNRTSTEGIRRAFHNFRCAAGMFTYINDNFLHAPSTDLSREVVKVLVQLMIAQATEVFVERMTEEKEKKPFGLRARVSTQAAFLYGGVIEDVKELANKGIFERSWTWLVQCKHKYFVSLAQYQRSLADSASSKHGEALTRLQIAETAAKEASRFATSFSACFSAPSGSALATLPSDAATSLLELTRTHLTLCNEAKMSEQRDNDLIYHDAQPSEAALPAIEKSSVGEPIAIQEVYGAPEVQKVVGQDIFVRLVPLSVHQSASLYSEEKAKLIRTEGERCDTADAELITALEFLGLPASLEKFNDLANNGSSRLNEMNEPPNEVFEWAETIRKAKETKQVEKMWEELVSIRQKVHSDIENIERKLDSDARDCEQMRVQYDHLWEQQPTSNFSKTWRHNLKCHREALDSAKKSDSQIDEIWQSAKPDLEILADPTQESIRRLFTEILWPQKNAATNSLLDVIDTNDDESEMTQMRNMVTAIEENVSRLQAIKKERHGVLQDLKERIQADDISQLLILNRKAQNIEPALFAAELEKFQAHSGRINATIHLQSTAIQELTAHYKSLAESRRGKEVQDQWANVSKKRAQLINRLQTAYQSHQEVQSALSKGNQFYRDIEADIAELHKNVSSFVNDRATERVRMAAQAEVQRERRANAPGEMHSLEHHMTRMKLANSSSPVTNTPPPPLPPQPRAWQATSSPNSTGPVYQQQQQQPFSAYPTSLDRGSAPTTQGQYSTSTPSPVDPYSALANFGSMFPSTTTNVQQGYPSQSRPPPPVQQNTGPAQPLPTQYSGQTNNSAPHQYATSPLPPVHRQYSGSVQPPVPPQYSGQAQAPIASSQQYSDQVLHPPPPAPQHHTGQFYPPPNSYQSNNTSYGPSNVSSKPALPPPPPPVNYQSAVAVQAHNSNSSYNSAPSLSPETHHYHGQPPLPSANAPPMHHYSSAAPPPPAPHASRPAVITSPQQPYYPSNAPPQSYIPNQPPQINPSCTPNNLNNFITTPPLQPYNNNYNAATVPGNSISSNSTALQGAPLNSLRPHPHLDPPYLLHHQHPSSSWPQQQQQLHHQHQNQHQQGYPSHHSYLPNSVPPPPPPGYQ